MERLFMVSTYPEQRRQHRVVTTVVGSPDLMGVVLGPLPAGLGNPWGLALGPSGELLIADIAENAILAAKF